MRQRIPDPSTSTRGFLEETLDEMLFFVEQVVLKPINNCAVKATIDYKLRILLRMSSLALFLRLLATSFSFHPFDSIWCSRRRILGRSCIRLRDR